MHLCVQGLDEGLSRKKLRKRMHDFLDFFTGMTTAAVAAKLVLATVLGSFVGMERANKRYAAGIRTFALVSLGSALATITGLYFAQMSGDAADIGRVPAQILAAGRRGRAAGLARLCHAKRVGGHCGFCQCL